jgi:hypothetical protein
MKEIAKTESLVDAYKINKPLKLNTVNKGKPTDNVLVHSVDNEVKFIPRSEFSGGSQTIDRVLEAGNTAVDKWLTINSYVGQPTVSILHGRFVSLINNFTGDKASLQNNQLFISNKEDTERTTILNDGIKFQNSSKSSTLMANPNSELSATGKVLLPITNDSSVKTLTATDDFKTINGNSIIGVGDITIEGGGEIPTLQEVFAKTLNSTYGAYSANDGGAKTQFVIGVDDGGFQEARIDGAVAVSSKSGSLGVYNGEVNFSQYSNGGQSSLSFTAPIATGGAANFKIPAKSTGDYVLATGDEITMQKVMETGIGYGEVTSPNGLNKVVFQTSAIDEALITGFKTFSINPSNINLISSNSFGSNFGHFNLEEVSSIDGGLTSKKTTVSVGSPTANTWIQIPAPTVDGNYTLATTSDFKTINGKSIVGDGDIVIGGGSQSLQQVINSGNKITNGANIINEYLDYSSFLGHQSLQFYNNTKGFSQLDERTLSFIDGTGNRGTLYGQGSNGQYYLPNKPSTRAYTLATTDDFKTINGNNIVGTGDIVIEGNATSGTFTPILTGVTNVKAITFHSATYTKVGDVVSVNVGFELSMNAANTVTRYTISLPFNRATNSPLTIGQGSCMSASSASTFSTLGQSDEKSSIRFFFTPTSTEGHLGAVTFQYSILQ